MSASKLPSHREIVELPVGFQDSDGNLVSQAEVRPVTGGDELWIGMSKEYNNHPNDMVYKLLLLSRTVTRLGSKNLVTISDVQKLHARDIWALEYAVYRITYGEESVPQSDGASG